tara:strand:+ start:3209 stop:3589 length:381 start_codon:yes stop_codon:yes gene_type:complete
MILFLSCKSDLVKKPNDLIDSKTMELIMQDIMLMKTISRNYKNNIQEKNWLGDKYIYEKFDVDSSQLTNSLDYYAKSPKIYLEIYNNILLKMETSMDSIDVLAKEEVMKIKEKQNKVISDSIKNLN